MSSSLENLPTKRRISDLKLEEENEVSVYLELIRVLEKDIDEIKAGNTKNGWTSWAIVAAMLGSILFFFGEVRKLTSFPAEEVKLISLFLFLFINNLARGYQLLSGTASSIKPGRVKWSNELYLPHLPALTFSLITCLSGALVAITSTLPILIKSMASATFFYAAAIVLLMLIATVRNTPVGAPELKNKPFLGVMIPAAILSVSTTALLFTQLRFPVGESATLPYLLAGFIIATVESLALLINSTAPSRLLTNLQDLRNDIIFLRVDIDEALKRYEALSEGETLPDAVQKEVSEVLSDLNVVEFAHANMGGLIQNMLEQLPLPEDSPQLRQQKRDRVDVFRASYELHKARCLDLAAGLNGKVIKLNKRISEVLAASRDAASESHLRSSLLQRAQTLDDREKQLDAAMRDINHFLDDPEKMPGELQEQIRQLRSGPNSGTGGTDDGSAATQPPDASKQQ